MSILYTVNSHPRAARHAKVDRPFPRDFRDVHVRLAQGCIPYVFAWEDVNPSSHVGVHESPSGSAAVQSPTPPFSGERDASHENVTDEALAVDIRTKNAERDKDEASAHPARRAVRRRRTQVYHRRIPHRLSGDVEVR